MNFSLYKLGNNTIILWNSYLPAISSPSASSLIRTAAGSAQETEISIDFNLLSYRSFHFFSFWHVVPYCCCYYLHSLIFVPKARACKATAWSWHSVPIPQPLKQWFNSLKCWAYCFCLNFQNKESKPLKFLGFFLRKCGFQSLFDMLSFVFRDTARKCNRWSRTAWLNK